MTTDPSHDSEPTHPTWATDAARRAFDWSGLPDFRALPELLATPCPSSLFIAPARPDAKRELHAIGVGEGSSPSGEPQDERGVVHVLVRAIGKPVALILMSRQKVLWEIELEGAASLSGIAISGPEGCLVRVDGPSPHVKPLAEGPREISLDADRPEHVGRLEFLKRLGAIGGEGVVSFQGEARRDRFVVPPYRDLEDVRAVWEAHLSLVGERSRRPNAPVWIVQRGWLSRSGTHDEPTPVPDPATKGVAFCESDGRLYAITDDALYAIDRDGAVESIEVPDAGTRGPFSGIACDQKRGVVLIASSAPEGIHYVFDPVARTFRSVPATRTSGGLHGLAHHPGKDVVFALRAKRVVILSPELLPLAELTHDPLPLIDLDERPTTVQLAVDAEHLVLCTWDEVGARAALDRNPDHVRQIEAGHVIALGDGTLHFLTLDDPLPRLDANGERRIWIGNLQQNPGAVIEEAVTSEVPVLLESRSQPSVVLLSYEVYEGFKATLAEIGVPGWEERLARADEELGARRRSEEPNSVRQLRGGRPGRTTSLPPVSVVWTPQAAEDVHRMAEANWGCMSTLFEVWFRQMIALNLPLAGPFAKLKLRAGYPGLDWRVALQRTDGEIWIAWIHERRGHARPGVA